MWYGRVKLLCLAKGIGLQGPGFLTMLYCEPTRKRDPDNIVGGGTKLLLDSLVGAGVLRGDGWGDNLGFIGYWVHRSNREGCLIHWGDEIFTKQAMEALLEKELENGTANDRRRAADDEPPGAHASKTARPRNARARGKLDRRA